MIEDQSIPAHVIPITDIMSAVRVFEVDNRRVVVCYQDGKRTAIRACGTVPVGDDLDSDVWSLCHLYQMLTLHPHDLGTSDRALQCRLVYYRPEPWCLLLVGG